MLYHQSPKTFQGCLGIRPEAFNWSGFARTKNGLMSALNNRFILQQAAGARTTNQKHLSIEDLNKLFRSDLYSRTTTSGFLKRVVLGNWYQNCDAHFLVDILVNETSQRG